MKVSGVDNIYYLASRFKSCGCSLLICRRHVYWSRVWIFQELALAKVQYLASRSAYIQWPLLYGFHRYMMDNTDGTFNLQFVESNFHHLRSIMGFKEFTKDVTSPEFYNCSLWQYLHLITHSGCADTRDRIYGGLALVDKGDNFPIDYNVARLGLLCEVFAHWSCWSWRYDDLEMLWHALDLRPDDVNLTEADLVVVPQASEDLPDSWLCHLGPTEEQCTAPRQSDCLYCGWNTKQSLPQPRQAMRVLCFAGHPESNFANPRPRPLGQYHVTLRLVANDDASLKRLESYAICHYEAAVNVEGIQVPESFQVLEGSRKFCFDISELLGRPGQIDCLDTQALCVSRLALMRLVLLKCWSCYDLGRTAIDVGYTGYML